MADNDQNDEYKFAEFDSPEGESPDHEFGSSDSKSTGQAPMQPKKDVKRNALIAVGLIIFAMVMYKLIGGIFSGKSSSESAKGSLPPAPVTAIVTQPQPQVVAPTEIAPQPIQQAQPVVQENNSAMSRKVDSIETNQQNLQSQVNSMNDQINNVNSNINNLSAQISKLNQVISDLTIQVSKQSEEINVLMLRTQPKPVRRVMMRPRHTGEANVYYINAVIPGRAWLIGPNGSTLTVREGTKIEGYGVVKLIDAMEGRVLTSSGRVIRFSQEDS